MKAAVSAAALAIDLLWTAGGGAALIVSGGRVVDDAAALAVNSGEVLSASASNAAMNSAEKT
jgi:hypothetical protein